MEAGTVNMGRPNWAQLQEISKDETVKEKNMIPYKVRKMLNDLSGRKVEESETRFGAARTAKIFGPILIDVTLLVLGILGLHFLPAAAPFLLLFLAAAMAAAGLVPLPVLCLINALGVLKEFSKTGHIKALQDEAAQSADKPHPLLDKAHEEILKYAKSLQHLESLIDAARQKLPWAFEQTGS